MTKPNKETTKHNTERTRYSSERYSRFFQTKGGMNIYEFERHLKK